jgi:hypothetical protein
MSRWSRTWAISCRAAFNWDYSSAAEPDFAPADALASAGQSKRLPSGIEQLGTYSQLQVDYFRRLATSQPVLDGLAFERFIALGPHFISVFFAGFQVALEPDSRSTISRQPQSC